MDSKGRYNTVAPESEGVANADSNLLHGKLGGCDKGHPEEGRIPEPGRRSVKPTPSLCRTDSRGILGNAVRDTNRLLKNGLRLNSAEVSRGQPHAIPTSLSLG